MVSRLLGVEELRLRAGGLEAIDVAPVLDIKPCSACRTVYQTQ